MFKKLFSRRSVVVGVAAAAPAVVLPAAIGFDPATGAAVYPLSDGAVREWEFTARFIVSGTLEDARRIQKSVSKYVAQELAIEAGRTDRISLSANLGRVRPA